MSDPVSIAALIGATISLAGSSVAIVLAFRAADRAQRAVLAAAGTAFAAQPTVPPQPTREERIAWARGHIDACRGAEMALEQHHGEPAAALMLAQYRAYAARAKHELRALGVES